MVRWPVLENGIPFDSNSLRFGPVDMAPLTISVIANKSSFSPPHIKLTSCEVTDPDVRPPEVDIGHVQLGSIERLDEAVGYCMMSNIEIIFKPSSPALGNVIECVSGTVVRPR